MSDDEDSKEEGKVVDLPVRQRPHDIHEKSTASIQLVINRNGEHCGHTYVELDTNQRRVTCRACKCELDTFDQLGRFANDYQRVANDLESTKKDALAAHARLELLRRLEANTRGRLRNLGVKSFGPYARRTGNSNAARRHGGRATESPANRSTSVERSEEEGTHQVNDQTRQQIEELTAKHLPMVLPSGWREVQTFANASYYSRHVNKHPYCLHLWRCLDGDVVPDFTRGGLI